MTTSRRADLSILAECFQPSRRDDILAGVALVSAFALAVWFSTFA